MTKSFVGVLIAVTATLGAHTASADPRVALALPEDPTPSVTSSTALPLPKPERRRHLVYAELLGKGGLWGAGYEYELSHRVSVGAVGSYSVLDGERITSFTPYVSVAPVGSGHHHWYFDFGAQVVHVATPSPVPEWSGTSKTGVGTELSTGYEYRSKLVFRVFGMMAIGRGGIAPWVGMDVGWAL